MTEVATLTIADIAERLETDIQDFKDAKFRWSRPTNLWCSSAGHPCDRCKFYEIARWDERLPARPGLQALFDQGHLEEAASKADIEEAGFQVIRAEEPVNIVVRGGRHRLISGRMDFFVTGKWLGRRQIPCEHKGLSYGRAEQITNWRDLITAPQAWLRKYPAQMQLYLLMQDMDEGLLALRGKESGLIDFVPIELDHEYCEGILQSAERVYDALDAGQEPPRMKFDENVCPSCDFVHICAPETEWVGNPVIQDADLESHLLTRAGHADSVRTYNASDKAIKARFERVEQEGTWRCGRWLISRKQTKAGSWQTTVKEAKQ